MTGLEIAALVAVGIWMLLLSLAVVLLVRQVSLISKWAQEQDSSNQDGLPIGSPVPEEALGLVPEADDELAYVWFLGGDCQPCREFAVEAARTEEIIAMRDSTTIVAAVTGTDDQANDFTQLLPEWIRVVRGDNAVALNKHFEIVQTPTVYEVERGNVTGRAVAGYGVVNFLNLVAARETSDAAEYAGPRPEAAPALETIVTHHGGDNGR